MCEPLEKLERPLKRHSEDASLFPQGLMVVPPRQALSPLLGPPSPASRSTFLRISSSWTQSRGTSSTASLTVSHLPLQSQGVKWLSLPIRFELIRTPSIICMVYGSSVMSGSPSSIKGITTSQFTTNIDIGYFISSRRLLGN